MYGGSLGRRGVLVGRGLLRQWCCCRRVVVESGFVDVGCHKATDVGSKFIQVDAYWGHELDCCCDIIAIGISRVRHCRRDVIAVAALRGVGCCWDETPLYPAKTGLDAFSPQLSQLCENMHVDTSSFQMCITHTYSIGLKTARIRCRKSGGYIQIARGCARCHYKMQKKLLEVGGSSI